MGQHEFPAAIAADHGLQFILRIPQSVAGVWRSGVWLAGEQWPHVASVDRQGWRRGADELGQRGQEVDGHDHGVADCAGGQPVGPAHQAGDANTSFPDCAFAFSERTGASGVGAITQPWTIVTGEDNQRVLGQSVPVQSG